MAALLAFAARTGSSGADPLLKQYSSVSRVSYPNCISISSATPHSPYTLQWPHVPLKIAPFRGGDMDPHESAPNGLTIDFAVIAQHFHVPNRQTDTQTMLRATSITTRRIYALRACNAA